MAEDMNDMPHLTNLVCTHWCRFHVAVLVSNILEITDPEL